VKELPRSLEARERKERPEHFDLAEALEEARRAPRSKPGDLWRVGEHRLMNGDAINADDVARLRRDPRATASPTPDGISPKFTGDGPETAEGPKRRARLGR
jgi:hypothetical protein